jgi:opacity protein-like surface antigen
MRKGLAAVALPLVLALPSARVEAGSRTLSLGAGRVDPQGVGAALWFTAGLRWGVARNVFVEPEGSYWKKKDTSPAGESSVEDVAGAVNVVYRFPSRRPLAFFAGGGVGLHLVRSSFSLADTLTVSDRELKQGLHLLAGAEYGKGNGLKLFVEVRHDLVADLQESKACAGIRLGI